MTTAEKRAQLEAEGQPWPTCECHGITMSWQRDLKLDGQGRFRCRALIAGYRNTMRTQRRQAGLCVWCSQPAVTEAFCQSCADRHAATAATPRQQLNRRAAQARWKQKLRSQEGFRPTGAGRAAMAAWTRHRGV